MSCIFHNFYNVVRGGVNSTVVVQKCVIKETKSHAFHLANPKAVLIDRNNIANSKRSAILVDWL